jgi:hypothetical protein
LLGARSRNWIPPRNSRGGKIKSRLEVSDVRQDVGKPIRKEHCLSLTLLSIPVRNQLKNIKICKQFVDLLRRDTTKQSPGK